MPEMDGPLSPPQTLDSFLADQLSGLDELRQLRQLQAVHHLDSAHVEIDGVPYVNFASNNYLGLTHHPRVIAAAMKSAASSGLGSGAAPLVTGQTGEHAAAETAIAAWKQTEHAVLLPSGYQANHAAIQTVAAVGQRRGGVRFLIDKLAHASLIDAVRGTGHSFRVFPHNGLCKLARLLADADASQLQVVVTESIFSMDGDRADLPGLLELKRRYGFFLLLDEAHASGVYGHAGAGLASELGVSAEIDMTVVTLSKAMGLSGAAICASANWCRAVWNFGRAYLFSTAIPPLIAAAACAAIDVMRDEPERMHCVRQMANRVRSELKAAGKHTAAGDSPIVPVVLGSESAAINAANQLRGRGLLVGAIRPPTVARGSSRLRVTLSCAHSDDEVSRLIDAIRELV